MLEMKVTSRSYDSPFDGAFGTSEYSRVEDSPATPGSVPLITATRVQTRYRWDAAAAPLQRLEAIELQETFDPKATGFGDLAGATPVLRVKNRLTFERLR